MTIISKKGAVMSTYFLIDTRDDKGAKLESISIKALLDAQRLFSDYDAAMKQNYNSWHWQVSLGQTTAIYKLELDLARDSHKTIFQLDRASVIKEEYPAWRIQRVAGHDENLIKDIRAKMIGVTKKTELCNINCQYLEELLLGSVKGHIKAVLEHDGRSRKAVKIECEEKFLMLIQGGLNTRGINSQIDLGYPGCYRVSIGMNLDEFCRAIAGADANILSQLQAPPSGIRPPSYDAATRVAAAASVTAVMTTEDCRNEELMRALRTYIDTYKSSPLDSAAAFFGIGYSKDKKIAVANKLISFIEGKRRMCWNAEDFQLLNDGNLRTCIRGVLDRFPREPNTLESFIASLQAEVGVSHTTSLMPKP